MRKTGVVLVLLLALSGPAAGRDIFVNNTSGDDRCTRPASRRTSPPQRPGADHRQGPAAGRRRRPHRAGGDAASPTARASASAGIRLSGTARPAAGDRRQRGGAGRLGAGAGGPVEARRRRGLSFSSAAMGFQQLFLDDRPAARVPVGHAAGSPPKLQPRQWCLFRGDISSASRIRARCPPTTS